MPESIEEIQARHRRELRELQGRITNKKKNATKKTRKGVNDECAAMESELKAKHQLELAGDQPEAEVNEEDDKSDADDLADKLADTSIAESQPAPAAAAAATPAAAAPPPQAAQPKRNRQKERLARRAAEQEALVEAAEKEASTMVDHGAVERASMKPLIAKSGRIEHPIQPDGHCLFSSVADQLELLGRTVSEDEKSLPAYRKVRHVAAEYMEAHGDDFAPFLLAYSGGDDAPDLATHITKIRDTAEWGGQMELVALANAYNVNIQVLHDGRSELIEPSPGSDERPTLWLVYYRHGYGLGEHYNSLRTKPE